MSDRDEAGEIRPADRVRIISGTFERFEAVVTAVDPASGKVSAEIHIFGKVTPVELQEQEVRRIPWQPDRGR